jgi:membrane associated rhomboid family serine protease
MGIHDRDYYHDRPPGSFHVKSVLAALIAINVAVWFFQVITIRSRFQLTDYLAAHPTQIVERFYLYFWQPLTANFLHAPKQIFHILFNMLFLFIFGREMEVIYGKVRFLSFFLTAGFVAILLEAVFSYFSGKDGEVVIYGASGAVMATVVLFTTHFPRQEFYLLLVPVPAWFLCLLFVAHDLLGLGGVSAGETQTAFLAHLGGAAFGLLWRLDLMHWGFQRLFQSFRSVRRRPRRLKPRRSSPPPQPLPRSAADLSGESRDPVSLRIDELLEKIHRSGRASLTAEELEYLQRNSGRYRSEN